MDRVGLLLLESGEHGNTLVLCVRPDLVDANAMVIGRNQPSAVAEGWQSGILVMGTEYETNVA